MPLPPKSSFTDATVTEGVFKNSMDSLRDWLALLLGTLDDYIRLIRGTTASRPAATESGWLRWNTDNSVLDISVGTIWHKLVHSIIDATFYVRYDASQRYLQLLKSTDGSNIVTSRIQCNSGDWMEIERTASQAIVRSSGTDPVKIVINGVTVFSIDSAGNVVAKGNVTAFGAP